MSNTIRHIRDIPDGDGWGSREGYEVITDSEIVELYIDGGQSCCEHYGYFLTEDDLDKFIGAELTGIKLTDTNRSNTHFAVGYDDDKPDDKEEVEYLDDGDVMFVDIETDRGAFQFVAYNSHNGYYGHSATVKSKALDHSEVL